MTTRAILLRAAELIEERGHARGMPENRRGNLCAIGAIRVAVTGRPRGAKLWEPMTRAEMWLSDALCLESIADWNDRSSAATVCAGLRKAAEAAG